MSQATVKMPLAEAKALAEELLIVLKEKGISKVEITGSVLREEKYIGDIDIICNGQIEEVAKQLGPIQSGNIEGSQRVILTYKGKLVNLFRTTEEEWGAMQMYLTGPKGSTIGMRMKARKKGLLLNQHGLFDGNGTKIAGETEEGIFKALDHIMKPPNLRGK
jgi:DNA polymerase (family 10)